MTNLLPPRFLAFCAIAAIAIPLAITGLGWTMGTMVGFDLAAIVFLASCVSLLAADAQRMRAAALRNDANRTLLLLIASVATLAVLAAVAGELSARGRPGGGVIALVVATLSLAWLFGNTVWALHYAHLYYLPGKKGDAGGLDVPGTHEPDYWDFVYFAFTLGMTFQTSDVQITSRDVRIVATAHSLTAFIFNLGVIAFTVNVIGGG